MSTILDSWYVGLDGDLSPFDTGLYSTFGELGFGVPDSILIPDHVERAKSLLIEQFKRPVLINKMVEAIVEGIQELEYVFNDLYIYRSVPKAQGTQLDGLGDLVGISRNGLSDDDYREAIYFQIFLNISKGEPETVIRALKFATKAEYVRYFQLPNATISLFTDGETTPFNLLQYIQRIVPAGVKVDSINTSRGSVVPLVFVDAGQPDPDFGGGLNELGYTPGGIELGGQFTEGIFT